MLLFENKTIFKFIVSKKLTAKENMQIDEDIFLKCKQTLTPTFRVYSWDKGCTIGISQDFNKIKDIQEYKNSFAKRITGGGVLFHGNDISYSLCIPTTYLKNLTVKQSYEKISLFILKFYKNLGLNPIYAKDDKNIQLKKDKFCQIGFEPYDILIDGKKIGGNAQRRDKKVIFQHGSINIKSYNQKEKYGYSLEDFGVNLTFDDAQNKLIKAFKQTFDTFEKA